MKKYLGKTNGITLVALVITIIILLILAGVAIGTLTQTGLFENAKKAKEKSIEAQLKEEISLAIQSIKLDEIPKGNNVTLTTLANGQLEEKLEDITATIENEKLSGEYKGYNYEIDSNFNIQIIGKSNISFSYTKEPTSYTNNQVIINIDVKIEEGLTLESVVGKTEGIEVIEDNKKFKVTKNGTYEFEITVSDENKLIKKVKIENIDKKVPEVKVTAMNTEWKENEFSTITYEILDDVEVDIEKCKYVFSKEKTAYLQENKIWESAINIENAVGTIKTKIEQSGKYYLHILGVDKAGNYTSYVSDEVTVKKEPLYLFNEGSVDGYTWNRSSLATGNSSSIINGAIYFVGTNLTWIGAEWSLSNLNLSGYDNIYIEVSTGTFYSVDNNRGVEITGDWYGNSPIVSVLTNNLNRYVKSGSLGKYAKSGTTLYLIFSRWNPGCYVHKIWVD